MNPDAVPKKKGFIAMASAPIARRWRKQRNSSNIDAEAGSSATATTPGWVRSGGLGEEALMNSSATVVPGNGMQRWHSSPERLRRVPENEPVDLQELEGDAGELDEALDFEEELEAQGLYQGSYKMLQATYTFAPVTFIVSFAVLAALPTFLYPIDEDHFPFSIPSPLTELLVSAGLWSLSYLLQGPIFSLSLLLCQNTSLSYRAFPIVLSTALHTIVSLLTRLSTIPLVLPEVPQNPVAQLVFDPLTWRDPAFRRMWWLALGWAAAEAVVGIKQGYEGISLYRDVLVDVEKRQGYDDDDTRTEEEQAIDIEDGAAKGGRIGLSPYSYGATEYREPLGSSTSGDSSPLTTNNSGGRNGNGSSSSRRRADSEPDMRGGGGGGQNHEREPLLSHQRLEVEVDVMSRLGLGMGSQNHLSEGGTVDHLEESLELQVDQDLDQLMALRARDDLERVYGMPFIRIPVFISCLQRVNSLLLSLGITLLLSSAYLRSSQTSSISPLSSTSTSTSSSQDSTFAFVSNSTVKEEALPSHSRGSGSSFPSLQPIPTASHGPLALTFTSIFLIYLFLSLMHTQIALPKLGVHTVVYVGAVVSLGTFFAGLGVWGALG